MPSLLLKICEVHKAEHNFLISFDSLPLDDLQGGRDVTDSGDKTIPWGSPDAPGLSTRPTLMSGPKTPGAQAALPDSFDTQRGLVPTPLGKYQVRLKILRMHFVSGCFPNRELTFCFLWCFCCVFFLSLV